MYKSLLQKRTVVILLSLIVAFIMVFSFSGCSNDENTNRQDLTIEKSGYTIDSDGNCNWGIIVTNPNIDTWEAEGITVKITGFNTNGTQVGYYTVNLEYVYPNGDMGLTGQILINDAVDYEFSIESVDNWSSTDDINQYDLDQVEYADNITSSLDSNDDTIFSADIINNQNTTYQDIYLYLILEDESDNIVGGFSTYSNTGIDSNSTKTIATDSFKDVPEYATIVPYVIYCNNDEIDNT